MLVLEIVLLTILFLAWVLCLFLLVLDSLPYPRRAAAPTGEAQLPTASRRFDSDPAASLR